MELVKFEIQQYKIKAQIARDHKEQRQEYNERAKNPTEEIIDGVADSE